MPLIKCSECGYPILTQKNHVFKIEGNYIYFGSYPQGKNGEIEPIKWRILSKTDNELFLLSEYILDAKRFDAKSNNYENSEIRKWLNNEFYDKAFDEEEKSMILTTEIDNTARSTNPNNESIRWNAGKNEFACSNTQDKVFILSQQEVTNSEYGFISDTTKNDLVREKKATEYAIKQGVYVLYGSSYWWLRSPDYCISDYSQDVSSSGDSSSLDDVNDSDIGVVPALKIKLS